MLKKNGAINDNKHTIKEGKIAWKKTTSKSNLIRGIDTKIKQKKPKINNIDGLGVIRCLKNIMSN